MNFLTKRERDVVAMLRSGNTDREIGAALHISKSTVRRHLERALLKSGAANRIELACQYAENIQKFVNTKADA